MTENDACDMCGLYPCEHIGYEANCDKWVNYNKKECDDREIRIENQLHRS